MLKLGSYANNTEFIEFLYIQVDVGLSVSIINEFQYFILPKVTSKNVVMVILEYLGVKVISGQHIDSVIKKKKTKKVNQLIIFRISKVFYSKSVFCKCRSDVKVEFVEIKNCSYMDRRRDQNGCSKEYYQLFISKNQTKVMRVDKSITSIFLFRVDYQSCKQQT